MVWDIPGNPVPSRWVSGMGWPVGICVGWCGISLSSSVLTDTGYKGSPTIPWDCPWQIQDTKGVPQSHGTVRGNTGHVWSGREKRYHPYKIVSMHSDVLEYNCALLLSFRIQFTTTFTINLIYYFVLYNPPYSLILNSLFNMPCLYCHVI